MAMPFRIGMVGPLPPPSGGMANQCRQLIGLLKADGLAVELVQTNLPYRPNFISGLRGVRAAFRLVPYLAAIWSTSRKVDVFHVFANSGWAWHLLAAPAIWVARLRGKPVVINYRGGNADPFLTSAPRWVRWTMVSATSIVVPSRYLQDVFARHGLATEIIPNIIDFQLFRVRQQRQADNAPCLLVARNLERIYDIPTAIEAFVGVLSAYPRARLIVAGSGPERQRLAALAARLGVSEAVEFVGRVDNVDMPKLYETADVAINPSTVDNMPNSLLEAFACGVPVVSTNVGGVPFIAHDRVTALLVPPRDPEAMAAALMEVLRDRSLYLRLRENALTEVQQYGWGQVREQWMDCYRRSAAKLHEEPS